MLRLLADAHPNVSRAPVTASRRVRRRHMLRAYACALTVSALVACSVGLEGTASDGNHGGATASTDGSDASAGAPETGGTTGGSGGAAESGGAMATGGAAESGGAGAPDDASAGSG